MKRGDSRPGANKKKNSWGKGGSRKLESTKEKGVEGESKSAGEKKKTIGLAHLWVRSHKWGRKKGRKEKLKRLTVAKSRRDVSPENGKGRRAEKNKKININLKLQTKSLKGKS